MLRRLTTAPLVLLVPCCLLTVVACEDPAESEEDTGSRVRRDMAGDITTDLAGDSGAFVDVGTLDSCIDALDETPFDLVPGNDDAQIQVDAAFDGAGLWVTYAVFDSDGGGDIWATRLRCDGTVAIAPFRLNTAFDANDLSPSVAVSGDRVLFVWQSDNSSSPNNLDIYTRLVRIDGTLLWDEERLYEGVIGGQVNESNAWLAEVASAPGGEFVMAGAWGTDGAPAFQVFGQRFDRDGEPVGEAMNISLGPTSTQIEPEIAVDSAGRIVVAWSNSDDSGFSGILARTFTPLAEGFGAPEGAAFPVEARFETDRVGVTFARDDTLLFSVSELTNEGSYLYVLDEDGTEVAQVSGTTRYHTPALAPVGADGAALLWHDSSPGVPTALLAVVAGDSGFRNIASAAPVAPYEPAFIPIADGVVFSAWTEGANPEFTVRGRFVRMLE